MLSHSNCIDDESETVCMEVRVEWRKIKQNTIEIESIEFNVL